MSALRPPSDFTCGYCGAEPGESCTTAYGKKRELHRTRFDSYRAFAQTSTWVVRLKQDDPRFGLAAGDELLVQKYPYDAKVSVIHRIGDGYDPECNQYLCDVEYVRVSEHEPLKAAA